MLAHTFGQTSLSQQGFTFAIRDHTEASQAAVQTAFVNIH